MRVFRLAIVGVLVALTAIVGRAQGPVATFHGVGPVPGNVNAGSTVRDATKVGSVIYAVGGWGNGNSVLWTWDGTDPVSVTQLPVVSTGGGGATAAAITRDALYIGGQARSSGGAVPVRVTRSLLPSASANLNLNAAPYTPLTLPASAQAISENGQVLYGGGGGAVRFDVDLGSTTFIPQLAGTTNNNTAPRGTSSDGSVLVGTSFNTPYGGSTNGHAFRYVHGAPGVVSAIPELAGGTWSKAIAVSPDGNLTLAGGDSPFLPNGESYLYDATSGTTTALGSPNTPWGPGTFGGLTADGSVVVTNFISGGSRYPYLHNNHGWFHLSSALTAAGVDLRADGWTMAGGTVFGVSPDGTLVFGQAPHANDDLVTGFRRTEGFVAEFPAGFLANYNPLPVAPANTSIVGAWYGARDNSDLSAHSPTIFFFLANGTYFHIETNVPPGETDSADGYERGIYTWDAVTGALAIKTFQDTNGGIGASSFQSGLTVTVTGDSAMMHSPDECPPDDPASPECNFAATRITGGAGTVVGGWVRGNPAVSDSSVVLLLLDDGTYYLAEDGDSTVDPSGHDGIEKGNFTWDSGTGAFSSSTTVDTNGGWGLSLLTGLQLSRDELVAVFSAGPGSFPYTRIVDPTTVVPVITSALSATGTLGLPFTYTVTATHGLTFNAAGLPAGLTIDSATGVISGTPTAVGTFNVTISATNTFLSTGNDALSLVITQPAVGLSASSLVFGNQIVGTTSAAQGVTLSNTGDGLLTLSITITGTNAADFAQVNTCGASVAPGGNCTIDVTFAPTNIGARTAAVTILDNATGSSQTIALSGTGKTGQMKMTPDPLTFSVQVLNTTSASQSVMVKNTGTTPAGITSISAAGEFAVASTGCGSTLAAAASCTVNVTFTPTGRGVRSGVLTVVSSAGTGAVTLSGTGNIASVAPTSVDFGNQQVGVTSAPRTVTLTNVSPSTTLNIASIAITGTNGGDFAISSNACDSTLAGGANCGIAITFKPTKKGPRSASIIITDNGGGGPHVVSLSGFGK